MGMLRARKCGQLGGASLGKDGISLHLEVTEVVLRQGTLQKYLHSADAEAAPEMQGGRARVPGQACISAGSVACHSAPQVGLGEYHCLEVPRSLDLAQGAVYMGACVPIFPYVSTVPVSNSATSPMPGSGHPLQ